MLEQLAQLRQPFPPELIQFRAGATNQAKDKAMALAFVDPRHYQDRLTSIFGFDWDSSLEHYENNIVFCTVEINGTKRTSSGQDSDVTKAEAQAFKRACTQFGLGRDLYNYPKTWIPYDQVKKQLVWGKIPKPYIGMAEPLKTPATVQQVQDYKELPDAEPLTKTEAQNMHVHISGKYRKYVKQKEHYDLASECIGEVITSFTQLTKTEATAVLEHIRVTAFERKNAEAVLEELAVKEVVEAGHYEALAVANVDISDEAARAVLNY